MDETLNFVNFIKERFSTTELKIVKFIYENDLLTYSLQTEKVKENDKMVEKPTNILDLSFLKLCAKKFNDSQDMMEKIFLFYIGYALRDAKSAWRLNLNNLETDLNAKCSYCSTAELSSCPFKLIGYILKCISDNKFDTRKVFKLLVSNEEKEYSTDEETILSTINNVDRLNVNSIDIVGAEMLLASDCVKIDKIEDKKIFYRYIDFNVKNNSFFNNLKEFYKENNGIEGVLNLSSVNISNSSSYIFNNSPIEIAVFIKYLCEKSNLDEETIIKRVLEKRKFKEIELRNVYYNQYIHLIKQLEITKEEKNEIISILTYIRNYYYNENLPYIHFNIALYTKNSIIAEKVVNILNIYIRTFCYIANKGTLWVDTEMLVKRTKDSIDMISQVDRMYSENDVIIFENLGKIKGLNEYRVDAFWSAIEKFNMKNKKSITIFMETEDIFKSITQKHPLIESKIINKKIHIKGFDATVIKNKILDNLGNIYPIDEDFKIELEKYINDTYNPELEDEYEYINEVTDNIIFNKFKLLEVKNKFSKEDTPKQSETRTVEEILSDINGLVGLPEVKERVNELIKYLDYTKKIDIEGFNNLNMIFKGNSGTGKTTVARLFAELFYKLGFIRQNKIIEVTSKDLIGSHLGETAPKTQSVIDSALDGVLFIDEAYTIMASKGGSSSNYPAECMATICKAMELYKDRLVIIFAGYTKEMNDFINENQGLMSRIGYELEFSDFSKDELIQIFKDEVNGNGFTLEDGVESKIEKLIIKNKIGRNFGNARFVTNLFDKLVITHSANYTDEANLKIITNKDVEVFESTVKNEERTVDNILEDLNSLTGLNKVKETINGFISVIELNKKLNKAPDFNMHMIFKGNAGTGKTTVARLVAEVYYNLGYIKRNKLVEVQSQDLIGEYLGQTGPKTQSVIESALDGVLFIDEAYAIMEHSGSNASYSAECVATLLKAMEDYSRKINNNICRLYRRNEKI